MKKYISRLISMAATLTLSITIITPALASAFAITINEYAVPTSSSNPWGVTTGADGNVWFTESAKNKIGKITTAGTITEYTIPTGSSVPYSITTGPDGNVWFTEQNSNKIGKITTAGSFTEYTVPTSSSSPTAITAGSDGNLWFTENNAHKIGKITTAGSFTEYTVPTSSEMDGMVAGPDGNAWFTETTAGKVAKITPAGTITEYALTNSGYYPWGIIAGPNGKMWFSENAGSGNNIASITISGSVVEYPIPTSSSLPLYLTTGSDGNIWFAEESGNKIGQLLLPPKPSIINKTTSVTVNGSVVVDVLTGVSGDPDSSTLSIVSGPSHGTAVDPPGTITYTPNPGYIGSDSLTYKVCSTDDPGICNTAVLSFNVVVAAPATGFGLPAPRSTATLVEYSLTTSVLFGLAFAVRKFVK